ncbi:hypothetical protein FHN55_02540 [Streptomyces sp. NP160]|nr:hypothetical protein FHN55_02540 [Streptomyces sp. NP160]
MARRADEDVDVLLVDLDAPCPCADSPGSPGSADSAVPAAADRHHPWPRRLVEAVVLVVLAPVVLGGLLPPPPPVAGVAARPAADLAVAAQPAPGPWVDARTAERTAVARVRDASPLTVVVPADAHRGSAPLPVMLTERGARYVVVLSCLRPAHLDVGLAGQEPASLACPTGAPVYRFTGRGHLVQVVVEVDDDVVWAAEVDTT